MNFATALKLTSGIAFLVYGTLCLFSEKMEREFERYRLKNFRVMVGVCEVAGAVGQLSGLWIPSIGLVSAVGLSLLMLCGLWTRWRIQDPWPVFLPAFILMVANAFLVWTEV